MVMTQFPHTSGEAEETGYTDGDNDGYAGNANDPYSEGDRVLPHLRAHYRTGYRQGYSDGQASYRRTVE
jgi:hypothetical protein